MSHYGWRIQSLSVFGNITSIEATDSREEPFPWFNTIFLSVITLALLFLALAVKRRRRRRHEILAN
jgi:hypothetical protein